MPPKATSTSTTSPKPIPAQEHQDEAKRKQTALLISVLQAPNPDYNLTMPEAEAIVKILRRFNVNAGAIAACQRTAAAAAVDFRQIDELRQLGIDNNTPLYLHCAINGTWHELADLRNDFTSGEYHNLRFRELWQTMEPNNPNPAADAIMNVDGRRTAAAVERILLEIIREEWANVPVASRTK